jgi:hypothetical protein
MQTPIKPLLGEHEWSRLFAPSSPEFREPAYEWREARFMVLKIEPCLLPSPMRGFQGKIQEASTRASLKTYTPNDLSVGCTRLILQEEIIFEQREVCINP